MAKSFWKGFKRIFLNRRFVLFCLFGCINTFNTGWISTASVYIIPSKNIGAIIGYFGSLSIAFLLDSKFVFRRRPSRRRYLRFLISYIPNFIIYFLVTFMTINTWHLPQFWATTLATLIGGPVTFVIIQFYAFKPKHQQQFGE